MQPRDRLGRPLAPWANLSSMGSISRRTIGWTLALGMASGIVVNGLRLRGRLTSLPVLAMLPPPGAKNGVTFAGVPAEDDLVVVHLPGLEVDEATVRAAAARM